jgi:hypothetical protein
MMFAAIRLAVAGRGRMRNLLKLREIESEAPLSSTFERRLGLPCEREFKYVA